MRTSGGGQKIKSENFADIINGRLLITYYVCKGSHYPIKANSDDWWICRITVGVVYAIMEFISAFLARKMMSQVAKLLLSLSKLTGNGSPGEIKQNGERKVKVTN